MYLQVLHARGLRTQIRNICTIIPEGVLHQIFSTRVQHTKKEWTQSDISFCKNEGSKKLKLMEKGVNWIENEGKIDTKYL